MQNAFAESFNGRLRDECLNATWFWTLAEVRSSIEQWRVEYNDARPPSDLARVPQQCLPSNCGCSSSPPPAGHNGWISFGGQVIRRFAEVSGGPYLNYTGWATR
jgi:hypothetical protein